MTVPQNILALIHEVAILFPVFLLLFSFQVFFPALIDKKILGHKSYFNKDFFTLKLFGSSRSVINLTIGICIIFALSHLDNLKYNFSRDTLLLFSIALYFFYNREFATPFEKHPLKIILSSIASPVGLLILSFLCFMVIKIGNLHLLPDYAFFSITEFIRTIIYMGTFLSAAHCIPLPPFAMGDIWYSIIPFSYYHKVDLLFRYSFVILIIASAIPSTNSLLLTVIKALQTSFESTFISILF